MGDIRDPLVLNRALKRVDAVVNFAALVGVGQSMYQIREYTSANNFGTASLLEELSTHPVECLVVASSMSIYGEGLYQELQGQDLCAPRPDARAASKGRLGGPRGKWAKH